MTELAHWKIVVQTEDGEKEAGFYWYDPEKNPLQEIPEVFDLDTDAENSPAIDRNELTRWAVQNDEEILQHDKEYWVLDCYDELGDYFSAVPDTFDARPTLDVAIPKESVVHIYCDTSRQPQKIERLRG